MSAIPESTRNHTYRDWIKKLKKMGDNFRLEYIYPIMHLFLNDVLIAYCSFIFVLPYLNERMNNEYWNMVTVLGFYNCEQQFSNLREYKNCLSDDIYLRYRR